MDPNSSFSVAPAEAGAQGRKRSAGPPPVQAGGKLWVPAFAGMTIMLHLGRVAFGEMDEVVFGRPGPRCNWRPEQSRKHRAVARLTQRFLALPMTLRERSRRPAPPVFTGNLQALTFAS